MKIVHISDTHLSKGGYSKVDPNTGMNLWEMRINNNFIRSIHEIIKLNPDAVIHTGDLFDVTRPKNSAIITAIDGIQLLTDNDIPFFLISGNHSMIKTTSVTSPLELINRSKLNITVVHAKPEIIDYNGIYIHMIPNMLHGSMYSDAIQPSLIKKHDYDLLMMHGLAPGIKKMATVAECDISSDIIQSNIFDYIALGHYHGQVAIQDNVMYSGSLEYLTYGEISDIKGGLLLDTDKNTINHIDLPHESMHSTNPIDCTDLTPSEITNIILKNLEDHKEGRILFTLINPGSKTSAIDYDTINEVGSNYLHIKFKKIDSTIDQQICDLDIHSIDYKDEFIKYIKNSGISQNEQDYVLKKGINYLEGAI